MNDTSSSCGLGVSPQLSPHLFPWWVISSISSKQGPYSCTSPANVSGGSKLEVLSFCPLLCPLFTGSAPFANLSLLITHCHSFAVESLHRDPCEPGGRVTCRNDGKSLDIWHDGVKTVCTLWKVWQYLMLLFLFLDQPCSLKSLDLGKFQGFKYGEPLSSLHDSFPLLINVLMKFYITSWSSWMLLWMSVCEHRSMRLCSTMEQLAIWYLTPFQWRGVW